jgi:hypothetical protein
MYSRHDSVAFCCGRKQNARCRCDDEHARIDEIGLGMSVVLVPQRQLVACDQVVRT